MNLTNNQNKALNELIAVFRETKFNYYNKSKLINKTGINDAELWDMNKKNLITKANGMHGTLIVINEDQLKKLSLM